MMATITAGSYTGTEGYSYSLAGLITSGIGAEMNLSHTQSFTNLIEPGASHGNFDPVKDQMMLKIPNMSLADPEVTKHSARLNKPAPVGGIMEISTTWLRDWHRHSHQVKVPLKYGVSEFDELWSSTPDAPEKWRDAFLLSPRVVCGIVPNALADGML
jgi:hypothetical protein